MADIVNFEKEVLQRSYTIPVLVDFWASWCGACRVLTPQLEILQERHKDEWALVKVNTEKHPELALRYKVVSIPSVKLFVDSAILDEFTGAIPGHQIEQWLQRSLPPRSYRNLKESQKLLHLGQNEKEENLLRRILSEQPENKEAKVFLARAIVFQNPIEAKQLVEGFELVGKLGELADVIKIISNVMLLFFESKSMPKSPAKEPFLHAISALYGNYLDIALENFIQSIKADKYFLDGYAIDCCIAIFTYLGEESEMTKKFRPVLNSIAYLNSKP